MEHLSVIITSVFGGIITFAIAWLAYNQKTKDKMTDVKIEGIKIENERKSATNNRHIATIHGVIWELLLSLNADRCFIMQPHPEQKHMYLSVAFEVGRLGVSPVKDFFINIPISSMAKFSKEIATTPWIYIEDTGKDIGDKKAQSMMILAGTKQLALRQLVDTNSSWIGTLVVENIDYKDVDKEKSMERILQAATSIQYILPPIN